MNTRPAVSPLMQELSMYIATALHNQTMAAKGSYENPLSREEEEKKARDLIVPVLGKARSEELLAQLWNFERIASVTALRPLYQC